MKTAGAVLLSTIALTASCGGGAHETTARTDLRGVWTHTLARAQLLATHASDYLQPENLRLDAGRYRLVLSHSRVTLSKQNPISTFHASGTYSVRGHTIAFRWTRAVERDAGSPPDRSCCDPPWRLRWSLYRDVLTLRQLPTSSFEVPPALWATGWRRQGA